VQKFSQLGLGNQGMIAKYNPTTHSYKTILRFYAPYPARSALKFAKSAIMTRKFFLSLKSLWVSKKAEFYADFGIAKNCTNIYWLEVIVKRLWKK